MVGNHEQVDGRDVRRMVAKEVPSPARMAHISDHILGDRRLSDRKAELTATVDARAPRADSQRSSVGSTPAGPHLFWDASEGARFPIPKALKASTMLATRVSGRMIVMVLRIDGNRRYNWIEQAIAVVK